MIVNGTRGARAPSNTFTLATLLAAGLGLAGCDRKASAALDASAEPAALSSAVARAPETVPPAAPFNGTPVSDLADAGAHSPYEQGKTYQAQGQLWMARLVLERKALGPDATKDETELLARVCQDQADAACVGACAKKLGRKIKMLDGGAPASAVTAGEHKEPDSDLANSRDLILKMQYEPARKTLEPKVLDGKASREEIRLLRTVCEKQGDRMCVALCDSKLK